MKTQTVVFSDEEIIIYNIPISLDISWVFVEYVKVLTKNKRVLRKKSSLR